MPRRGHGANKPVTALVSAGRKSPLINGGEASANPKAGTETGCCAAGKGPEAAGLLEWDSHSGALEVMGSSELAH